MMKKKLVLFSIALYCISPASAQKATGILQRLIAQAYYEAPGSSSALTLADSAHYTYSGLRGSRFDYNNLRYTDLTQIGSFPVADFINMQLSTNNIDSSDLPAADFDTAAFFVHIGTPAPGPLNSFEGRTYTAAGAYDRVNNMVYDATTGALTYGQRSVNIYTAGRLTRVYVTSYNAGVYDTSFIRDFVYDGAGRMLMDSLTVRMGGNNYVGFARTVYTYSSGTSFITAVRSAYKPNPSRLVVIARTTDTHYPDGRVKTRFYEGNFSGGPLSPGGIDSFGYTPGVAGHTYLRSRTFDAAGQPEYSYYTLASRINAAGQKDSVTYTFYQHDTLQGASSTAVVYNADGYPVLRSDYALNAVTFSARLYSVEHYYYESYNTGVHVPAVRTATVSVFPNPTTGIINLQYSDAKPGTPISVRITNTAGQLVHAENFRMQGTSQQIMLGPEAAPGTYYLTVYGVHGEILCIKSVLKL